MVSSASGHLFSLAMPLDSIIPTTNVPDVADFFLFGYSYSHQKFYIDIFDLFTGLNFVIK